MPSSLSQRLNPNRLDTTAHPTEELSVTKKDVPPAKDLLYLYTIITEKFKSSELSAKTLRAQVTEEQLVLSLPGDVAFAAGSDAVSEEAKDLVYFLGDVVGSISNAIEVVGHSDPSPLKNSPDFPSNWELSLSRAVTVADILRERGYIYKIEIFGRASSTMEDLSSDVPEEERKKFLRRVDIVIKPDRAELK